jgi:hypothetical protein
LRARYDGGFCHQARKLQLFSYLYICLDLADSHEDLGAQFGGGRVAAAVLGDQAFHHLVEAVFAQAGRALIEVLADMVAVVLGYLAVKVPVNTL